MKPTGTRGLTAPNTSVKLGSLAKSKVPDSESRPYQGRQLSKVPDTVKRLPSDSGSESGYDSGENPETPPPRKKPINKALIAVKHDLPALPVDLESCTLDTKHLLYETANVQLIPVKDASGRDTSLLFKTYPKALDEEGIEGKKAWAMKSLTNEAYVFNQALFTVSVG